MAVGRYAQLAKMRPPLSSRSPPTIVLTPSTRPAPHRARYLRASRASRVRRVEGREIQNFGGCSAVPSPWWSPFAVILLRSSTERSADLEGVPYVPTRTSAYLPAALFAEAQKQGSRGRGHKHWLSHLVFILLVLKCYPNGSVRVRRPYLFVSVHRIAYCFCYLPSININSKLNVVLR